MSTSARSTRIARLITAVESSGRGTWWGLFLGALVVYVATAHWGSGQITDAIVASWPGWHFVHHGTFDLAGADLPQFPGLVEQGDRVIVTRSMGVVLAGVPGSALLAWTGASAETGGALSAVLMSAAAVANIGLALRSIVPARVALLSSAVLGLGTGMWTIASAELWGHGPDALWLSLAVLAVSRGSWWWAGFAMAPAIMTRPHLALTAAVIGIWLGAARRSLAPVVGVGIPSCLGLVLLQRWNAWYFGQSSVEGAYTYAVDNATRAPTDGLALWVENIAGTLISPMSGLLLYSPVVVVAAVAVARRGRCAPMWTWALAAGGLAYFLVQMRVSPHFDGGGSYYGNRYTIESLVLTTPLAAVALYRWAAGLRARILVIGAAASSSVGLYLYGAILPYWWVPIRPRSSWQVWYPYDVATYAGPAALGAAVAALAVIALTMAILSRTVSRAPLASAAEVPHDLSSAVPVQRPGAAASTRR